MICPQCTSENRKSARFCKQCGASLAKHKPTILEGIVGCAELKDQISVISSGRSMVQNGNGSLRARA